MDGGEGRSLSQEHSVRLSQSLSHSVKMLSVKQPSILLFIFALAGAEPGAESAAEPRSVGFWGSRGLHGHHSESH